MRFKDLEVWKRSCRLSIEIYKGLASLQSNGLGMAIKNAGLLFLCVNLISAASDLIFDYDENSVDDIYAALTNHDFIH